EQFGAWMHADRMVGASPDDTPDLVFAGSLVEVVEAVDVAVHDVQEGALATCATHVNDDVDVTRDVENRLQIRQIAGHNLLVLVFGGDKSGAVGEADLVSHLRHVWAQDGPELASRSGKQNSSGLCHMYPLRSRGFADVAAKN